jgi:hypothetical protein
VLPERISEKPKISYWFAFPVGFILFAQFIVLEVEFICIASIILAVAL